MPRRITTHLVPGAKNHVAILANDAPAESGANHEYLIGKPVKVEAGSDGVEILATFRFHRGPIAGPQDLNGVTNESLLAVVIDRLAGFQSGPHRYRDNACAITHLEEALMWIMKRTASRVALGIEGTLKPG